MTTFLYNAFINEEAKEYLILNMAIGVLIVLSVLAIIFESVVEIERAYHTLFIFAEGLFTFVFTAEYIFRLYVSPKPAKYARSFFGIIDLLSFLPSYFILFLGVSLSAHFLAVLRVLRILRLLRLFRVLKITSIAINRQSKHTATEHLPWLNIIIYVVTLLSFVVISGTLMYMAESGVPGTAFTNIPQGMWWAVVTITTVGYGDIAPITVVGKLIAATTMLSGLLFLVLMISVLGKPLQTVIFGTTLEEQPVNDVQKKIA